MRIIAKIKDSAELSSIVIYVAAFIIPIIIGLLVYKNAMMVTASKAESSFNSGLVQVKDYVDSQLSSADRIYSQITLFENIQFLYTGGTNFNESQLFYIYKLLPRLRTFSASNRLIDNVFIYFPKNDYMISGAGTYDKMTINNWFDCLTGLDKKKIFEIISKSDRTSYIPINFTDLKTTSGLHQRQAMIAYIRPVHPVKNQLPHAVVIIFIKQSEVLNEYNSLFSVTKGNISVISRDSRYLFGNAPDYLSQKKYPYFAGHLNTDKPYEVAHEEGLYVVNNILSDVSDWHYILSIPEKIYYAITNEINNVMLICVIIYLVSYAAVAWYFYKKNFKPLHRLLQMFKGLGKGYKEPNNEFAFIEYSVMALIDNNNKTKSILEKQKDNIKLGILRGLISGYNSQDAEWYVNNTKDAGLCLNKRCYFVFIIYPVSGAANKDAYSYADSFCSSLVYNDIIKGFEDIENIYCMKSENMYICIANTDMEPRQVGARACKMCLNITRTYGISSNMYIALAVSGVHNSIKELSIAYNEALEVIEYNTYLDNWDTIFYEDMNANFNPACRYTGSIETELQIINFIKSREYGPAIDLINKQMNGILQITSMPLSLVKCRMFGIINLLLNIIGEMRNMYDFKFMEEIGSVEEVLLGCRSFQELQYRMNDIFSSMRSYIEKKEKELESSRMRAIVDFVKDNFSCSDMSITYLSQVFNMNESHISRSFKKYAGMGFLDYLHTLRLVEAKKLIGEGGMNVKTAASMVGYTNDITLIRAFKRYEGITPGKLKSVDSKTNEDILHQIL